MSGRGAVVTFAWRPPADCKKVQLAGSFTGWQPVDMLPPANGSGNADSNHQGYWTLERKLEAGVHDYKYVADGAWKHDETKEVRCNDMGSMNNVITIEEFHKGRMSRDLSSDSNVSSHSSVCLDRDDEDYEIGDWEVLDKNANSNSTTSPAMSSSIEIIDNPINETGSVTGGGLSRTPLKKDPKKSSLLEVERKFAVPPDYGERLEANGFKLVQDFGEELDDTYFDFAAVDFPLLTHDYWLRQRNGDWELKYPLNTSPSSTLQEGVCRGSNLNQERVSSCTLYHETSDVEDIMCKLSNVLGSSSSTGMTLEDNATLGGLVSSGTLKKFAQIRTKRQWFKRDEDNVTVVIDATDWGYLVGEIEIMVEDPDQVVEASRKIDIVASSLEFFKMDLISIGKAVQSSS